MKEKRVEKEEVRPEAKKCLKEYIYTVRITLAGVSRVECAIRTLWTCSPVPFLHSLRAWPALLLLSTTPNLDTAVLLGRRRRKKVILMQANGQEE